MKMFNIFRKPKYKLIIDNDSFILLFLDVDGIVDRVGKYHKHYDIKGVIANHKEMYALAKKIENESN